MMTDRIETYIVDAFTDKPFKGNPAGVCVLNQELSDAQMQSISKELGFSETAYISPYGELNEYLIRYFSPKMEIPLCGHATLAASKVLFEINPEMDKIHFSTIQDLDLLIKKNESRIEMEFPVYDTVPQVAADGLLNALGIERIINSEINKETNILLLEIESSETLNNLSPDFERLQRSHDSINGVLVTAVSQRDGFDFESRYFWPWSGTNEGARLDRLYGLTNDNKESCGMNNSNGRNTKRINGMWMRLRFTVLLVFKFPPSPKATVGRLAVY